MNGVCDLPVCGSGRGWDCQVTGTSRSVASSLDGGDGVDGRSTRPGTGHRSLP